MAVEYLGVFWVDCHTARIYAERIKISDGEDYNRLKIYPRAHIDMWRKIQMMNPAWKGVVNYEDIPRGRIALRQADSRFIILLGSDSNTPKIRKAIAKAFNLKYDCCEFVKDEHYELPESY